MNKANDPSFLSVNQLYNLSDEYKQGVPFKDWIDPLKTEYSNASNSEFGKPRVDFVTWVNRRQIGINRAKSVAEASSKMAEGVKQPETVNATAEEIKAGRAAQEAKTLQVMNSPKNILGMKPIVFYSVATVTILGIATGIFFYMKRKKNQ